MPVPWPVWCPGRVLGADLEHVVGKLLEAVVARGTRPYGVARQSLPCGRG